MLGFNDIFKSKILERVLDLSVIDMLISFIIALGIGIFIFYIYKYTFTGVMYSRSFNLSLICLTIITNLVIMAITQNIVLSLGMVGALSIVRFRTAIKDPLDLVFLFWAIGVGIISGAGAVIGISFFILAVLGSLFLGALLIFTNMKSIFETPYLVIVNCTNTKIEEQLTDIVKKTFGGYKLKSKIVSSQSGAEFIYEIRCKNTDSQIIEELSAVEGVLNSSLVSYNGDYSN